MNDQPDNGIETPFDKFQLEEYKNISNSHFESIKQVTIFFRYYLLILTAPVFILTIVSQSTNGLSGFLAGSNLPIYYDIVFYYLATISIAGFFIFLYIVNLRHDAVLYAQSVNKVRRYFYHLSDLDISQYENFLNLPIVSTKPKYSEKTFFVPLLFVFSFINGGLISSAFYLKSIQSLYFVKWNIPLDIPINVCFIITIFVVFFILHILGYLYLAYRRDNIYLKHYSFGIDIDGVLNNQTEHFVEWLEKLTSIRIDKSDIKEIPVSLNSSLGITSFHEKLVFNTKEYWEQLPLKLNANIRVNDFQKRFGYRIYFFSYRDWPQYGSEENKIRDIIKDKGFTPLEKNQISNLTINWLKAKNINALTANGWMSSSMNWIKSLIVERKKLVIEMGNPYISDSRYWNRFRKSILNKNRFQGAKMSGFRFFIEDTPENAIKLSSLCDYVFMFDEPYNADENYRFPKNVIRVTSWDDIYRHLKLLS